jgi:hypothetical protein
VPEAVGGMSPVVTDRSTLLPVDLAAVELRYLDHERHPTHGYDTAGALVEMPGWRVHCARITEGAPELWSIVVPVEPPRLAWRQRLRAPGLAARWWTAGTAAGWTLSAEAVEPAGSPDQPPDEPVILLVVDECHEYAKTGHVDTAVADAVAELLDRTRHRSTGGNP